MVDVLNNPLAQFIARQDALLAASQGSSPLAPTGAGAASVLPGTAAPSQPGLANLRPQASVPVDPLQVNPTGAGNPAKVAQLLILAATEPEAFAAQMDAAGVPAPASLEEVTGGTQPGLANIRPQANVPSDPLQVNPTGIAPTTPAASAPAPSIPAFAQDLPTVGPQIGASAGIDGIESQNISDFFQSLQLQSSPQVAPEQAVQFASTTDPGSDLFVPPTGTSTPSAPTGTTGPAPLGLPQNIVPEGFGGGTADVGSQPLSKLLSGIRAPGGGASSRPPPSAGVIAPRPVNSGLLELLFQPLPQVGR